MFESMSLIMLLVGIVIGFVVAFFIFNRKTSTETQLPDDLDDVKVLVQNLTNQIAARDGKDDERYDVINKITTAFTGGTKKQGMMGEILLNNILNQAGLREGKDFELQKKFDDEVDGELKRKYPDVIVHLPDERDLIIDSKVSLTAWKDYCEAETDDEKSEAHKRHIISIRSHIKKLSEANYQKIYEIKSLDAVIMFMPYESAFDSMMDKLEDIIVEANKYKVILASPSTLVSVLKIVDNMWSINERNKNADQIANTALEIYSQVEKVYTAFESAGLELRKSMNSVETAKSRLRDGKGSLVSRVEKMIKLGGLTPDKRLPANSENLDTKIKKIK